MNVDFYGFRESNEHATLRRDIDEYLRYVR